MMMEVRNKKTQYAPYKKIGDEQVVVMWDFKPITKTNAKGEVKNTPLAVWQEERFDHIPTLDEIKNVIKGYYNKITDQKILSGFVWNGMKIWLSTENQFNYKAAYDLAVQTNGANLPIVFKFGDDNETVYHEFKDLNEMSEFYMASIAYIQNTLAEGWQKKDSIDWTFYTI